MCECTVIVGATVLFAAHKQGFLRIFEQLKWNPAYNVRTSLLLDFHTRFQE
jgi:hypothetical protein